MKCRTLFSRGIPFLAAVMIALLQMQARPGFAGDDGYGYGDGPSLPAQITGRVYVDLNNDGIHQMTGPMKEPGISGVLVTLTGTDDLGNNVKLSMHTGKVGTYRFKNLRPGTYTVTERQPRQYLDGLDAREGVVIPGSNKTDVISGIVVASGQTVEKNNFGELPLPSNLQSDPAMADPIGNEGRGGKRGCHHGGCCGQGMCAPHGAAGGRAGAASPQHAARGAQEGPASRPTHGWGQSHGAARGAESSGQQRILFSMPAFR